MYLQFNGVQFNVDFLYFKFNCSNIKRLLVNFNIKNDITFNIYITSINLKLEFCSTNIKINVWISKY